MIPFLVKHEGSNSTTGIGVSTGLTANTNSSTADTELVLSAGDSTRRRRHGSSSDVSGDNQSG